MLPKLTCSNKEQFLNAPAPISLIVEGILIVEIAVDSAEDLVTAHKGINFTQGSIAWDISTGDFYGLTSTGDWVKQGASDDSDDTTQSEDVQQSNAVSPNNAPLNLNSGLNRPVTLDEPKGITTIPEVEKADTSDSEGIFDDVKEEPEETEEQTEDIHEEVTEEEPESEEIVEEEIIDDEPTLEEDDPEETEEEPVIDDISEEQEEEPAEEEGE